MSKNGRGRPRPAQVAKIMERKQGKERKKVAEHVHRLQQLQAGDQNPHIQELRAQVAQLLKGHNDLVEAYNQNTDNFSKTLATFDAKLGGLALAIDDLVQGGVENVTKLAEADVGDKADAVGKVYWAAYIKHYIAQVQEAIAHERVAAAEAQVKPFDPLVTPETVEQSTNDESADDVVFGGSEDGETSSGHAAASAAG